MSGTHDGGLKTVAKVKERFGEDFYKVIGSKGGKASGTGGFYYAKKMGDLDHIRQAGSKGGKNRWPSKSSAPTASMKSWFRRWLT